MTPNDKPSLMRLLDANANRAREALRTMEDAARFLLDHRGLASRAKQLRHQLREALSHWPELEHARDTQGDVGTTVKTEAEYIRQGPSDVIQAAAKRTSEALRCLEEYGKCLPGSPAPAIIEQIRYQSYTLHQDLLLSLNRPSPNAVNWKTCLLLSCDACVLPWQEVLDQCLEVGLDSVQVREKNMEGGALLSHTKEVIERCRAYDCDVVVNDRLDIAMAASADGVHLGQNDLPLIEARKICDQRLLIGISTHNIEQAIQAHIDGADYIGVGPMFDTTTRPDKTVVGTAYLQQCLEIDNTPHMLAIGGITPQRISNLPTGSYGIALSAAILQSSTPGDTLQNCVDALATNS